MTEFTSDNQPKGRGKAFKTLLMEAIKEESMIGVSPSASRETTEKAYIKHFATRAFDAKDKDSAALLRELLSKSYPALKPTMEAVNFSLTKGATPAIQAAEILLAASNGDISPDVAVIFISAIKSNIDIEINTDIKARIEKIEELLLGDAR